MINDNAFARRHFLELMAASGGALGAGTLVPVSPIHAEPVPADVWDQFCERLKLAGQHILRPEAPTDELDRAEGWRYLSRLLRVAVESEVECRDTQYPRFWEGSNETVKQGADNPDNHYYSAYVDGNRDYRIHGTRGTVNYIVNDPFPP